LPVGLVDRSAGGGQVGEHPEVAVVLLGVTDLVAGEARLEVLGRLLGPVHESHAGSSSPRLFGVLGSLALGAVLAL
jgi:hypothetical protein